MNHFYDTFILLLKFELSSHHSLFCMERNDQYILQHKFSAEEGKLYRIGTPEWNDDNNFIFGLTIPFGVKIGLEMS